MKKIQYENFSFQFQIILWYFFYLKKALFHVTISILIWNSSKITQDWSRLHFANSFTRLTSQVINSREKICYMTLWERKGHHKNIKIEAQCIRKVGAESDEKRRRYCSASIRKVHKITTANKICFKQTHFNHNFFSIKFFLYKLIFFAIKFLIKIPWSLHHIFPNPIFI